MVFLYVSQSSKPTSKLSKQAEPEKDRWKKANTVHDKGIHKGEEGGSKDRPKKPKKRAVRVASGLFSELHKVRLRMVPGLAGERGRQGQGKKGQGKGAKIQEGIVENDQKGEDGRRS